MSQLFQKVLLSDSICLKISVIRKRQKKRRPTNRIYLERARMGEFHHLYKELRSPGNQSLFFGYARMSPITFDYILNAIRPEIRHSSTNFQCPISVEERLMLTLRYLATGLPFRQLAYSFRISKSAVSVIIIEICEAIWKRLVVKHMPEPTEAIFKKISNEFWDKWQFPNCIGCIDGKHKRIKKPQKSGSMYYCYKNFFSLGLLAVTDVKYKFSMVDIGSYGKENDAGVFENCPLRRAVESGKIRLPEETFLPGSSIKASFVFLGNEAFPLTEYLMRPYPRTQLQEGEENDLFNYRLSRARMVVECAFGIMVGKFRLLGKSIETTVDNAVCIVKAITLLHNIIIDMEGNINSNQYPDTDNNTLAGVQPSRKYNASTKKAICVRKKFSRFFRLAPLQRV